MDFSLLEITAHSLFIYNKDPSSPKSKIIVQYSSD